MENLVHIFFYDEGMSDAGLIVYKEGALKKSNFHVVYMDCLPSEWWDFWKLTLFMYFSTTEGMSDRGL